MLRVDETPPLLIKDSVIELHGTWTAIGNAWPGSVVDDLRLHGVQIGLTMSLASDLPDRGSIA